MDLHTGVKGAVLFRIGFNILARLLLVILISLISLLIFTGLDIYVYPITFRTTTGIRPLPDVIYMRPQKSQSIIDGKSVSYKYFEDKVIIDKEALKIVRKSGKYYWDSQDGQRLYMATGMFKQGMRGTAPRTIFITSDASTVIYVDHDTCNKEHVCGGCTTAFYREYRLNEMQLFSGYYGFFPPRPKGWCEELSNIRSDPWERPWLATFMRWVNLSDDDKKIIEGVE